MQIFKAGSWRSPTALKIFSGGSWRSIVSGQAYINGAWRNVCSFSVAGGGGGTGMTLSLSSNSVHATGPSSGLTSNSVTVTPSGGTAPYHYAWSIISNDGNATYGITQSNFATTQVSENGITPGNSGTCSIHCVVTDSSGLSATSGTVTANFTNTA